MARFVVRREGMNYVLRHPDGPVGRDLKRRARKLQGLARKQVGVKSGALRRSISYKVVSRGSGLVAVIGSNNKIALMHHNGTRPHMIAARRASTLRFYSRGRIVYAKVVHHPGTRPNRYLTDNLSKVV